MIFRLISFFTLLLFLSACRQESSQAEDPMSAILNTDWANDPLWDDGKAEVAHYEAERVIYGKPRQFEYTYILVKEEFNREFNVKTDDYDRSDLFTVMKVNKFARIPTEKYPYHFLTSLFYKREEPGKLHKMTSSSQEWCGNTFKVFENKGNNYRYLYSSYWDQQGNDYTQVQGGIWFEDGLSYTLRSLNFSDGLQFEQPVLESQISNKANTSTIYNARFEVSESSTHSQKAWQVRVHLSPEKTNTYWFAEEYPNILLKQESWDGRKLSLKVATRDAYWE